MRNVTAWSLRRRLLLRLSVPLSLILIVGAVGTFAVASHIGAFVHDRWLLDSTMTLPQQIKPTGGRIVLDLPKSAMEMFEWDTVDHVFEQVQSEKNGVFFGNGQIPLPALHSHTGPQCWRRYQDSHYFCCLQNQTNSSWRGSIWRMRRHTRVGHRSQSY